MIRHLLFAALLLAAPSVFAQETDDGPHREHIEWVDIWFTAADKDDLPRVLIIGDSIARSYFNEVESDFIGKAYFGRWTTSRSVADPVYFQELDLVLGQYDFDVIVFNNGLHGWAYTEEEYRAGYEKLVEELLARQPDADLVCATSTFVTGGGSMREHATRVMPRNRIARAICEEAGIHVIDLRDITADNRDFFAGDGVHLVSEGRKALAEIVSTVIANKLEIE